MSDDEECTCGGMPENAVVLNTVTIIEYMDADSGEIFKMDFSHDSSGQEIDHGKLLELLSWCKLLHEALPMADLVIRFMEAVAEDDE